MNAKNLVSNSLGLYAICELLDNGQSEFFFVNRNAKLYSCTLESLSQHSCVRMRTFKYKIIDIYKHGRVTENISNSGIFFDKYYRYGHFFSNKFAACRYIDKRILANPTNLSKQAKPFLQHNFEWLI